MKFQASCRICMSSYCQALSLLLTSKTPNEAVKQRSSEMQRALWHFGTIQCVYRNRTPPSRDGYSVITKEPSLRYSKVNVCTAPSLKTFPFSLCNSKKQEYLCTSFFNSLIWLKFNVGSLRVCEDIRGPFYGLCFIIWIPAVCESPSIAPC